MIPMWLLLIFVTCAVMTVLLCGIAKRLFPNFRSGEYKLGPHRSDLPAGGREIKTIELPLVGGPALTLAVMITGFAAGFVLNFSHEQWTLLLIALAATLGYMTIGLFAALFVTSRCAVPSMFI